MARLDVCLLALSFPVNIPKGHPAPLLGPVLVDCLTASRVETPGTPYSPGAFKIRKRAQRLRFGTRLELLFNLFFTNHKSAWDEHPRSGARQ